MKIAQLTPGAGGMYCGCCVRDNALVAALRNLGHDALLAPLYLPLRLDEPDRSEGVPIFFGGINVYLQQKSALFRNTPSWLDRPLDTPGLLGFAQRFAARTSAQDLGDLTLSMLRGEEGRQAKELDRLIAWLRSDVRPDVVVLSNALLAGLARRIRVELPAPVVCTLHGEDSFLDGLPEPHRTQSWQMLAERVADVDVFVAVSEYYAGVMRERLKLARERVAVVRNGISLEGFRPAQSPPDQPVLGYFARLCRAKGLAELVEAFVILKQGGRVPNLKLRAGGSLTSGDEPFLQEMRTLLDGKGLGKDAEFVPNLDREGKLAFYRSLSVLSVPSTYGEAFGLFVVESLASGVPVVLPRRGAFPELVEATGGGVLCETGPRALAASIEELLLDRDRARQFGEAGRQAVLRDFSLERMARECASVYEKAAAGRRAEAPAR